MKKKLATLLMLCLSMTLCLSNSVYATVTGDGYGILGGDEPTPPPPSNPSQPALQEPTPTKKPAKGTKKPQKKYVDVDIELGEINADAKKVDISLTFKEEKYDYKLYVTPILRDESDENMDSLDEKDTAENEDKKEDKEDTSLEKSPDKEADDNNDNKDEIKYGDKEEIDLTADNVTVEEETDETKDKNEDDEKEKEKTKVSISLDKPKLGKYTLSVKVENEDDTENVNFKFNPDYIPAPEPEIPDEPVPDPEPILEPKPVTDEREKNHWNRKPGEMQKLLNVTVPSGTTKFEIFYTALAGEPVISFRSASGARYDLDNEIEDGTFVIRTSKGQVEGSTSLLLKTIYVSNPTDAGQWTMILNVDDNYSEFIVAKAAIPENWRTIEVDYRTQVLDVDLWYLSEKSAFKYEDINKITQFDTAIPNSFTSEEKKEPAPADLTRIYILIGVIVISGIAFFIYRRKKAKSEEAYMRQEKKIEAANKKRKNRKAKEDAQLSFNDDLDYSDDDDDRDIFDNKTDKEMDDYADDDDEKTYF